MRNIFKKSLLFIAACFLATNLFAQKTYTFDDGVALATDWTVVDNAASVGSSAVAECSIASNPGGGSWSPKAGNYLYFGFKNKSGITISVTTTASFNNITNITFDAVASDNSKPSWALDIVDDNGNVVKNIYSGYGTKNNFGSSGTNKWGVSNSDVNPAASGHVRLTLTASSSGKYAAIDNLVVTYQAGPSTDATLKSLSYNSTAVTGFSANTLNYEVELPAGTTAIPTIAATATDAAATVSVTPPTSLPGNATVTVTAEDGTTTKTYTITFTVASSAPKVTSATWTNIKGTATIDQVTKTITGKVTNGSSLTTITPQFTGDNIASWTPQGAQNFSNGAVTYTFTSSTNEQTTYTVTITEAPALSTDATLSNLTYGGTPVPNFSPSTLTYNIELTAGVKTPPAIAATANESHATVNITQAASVPGVGKVEVTAEDGETKLTYTINYTVKVPSSDLTTHVPEIYEAKSGGGYSTPLVVNSSREYEVYYMTRDLESEFCIATTNIDKTEGITNRTSDYAVTAKDGWFKFSGSGWSSASDALGAEFGTMSRRLDMDNSCEFSMHISGFDEFALVARDKKRDTSSGQTKPDDNRYLEVYIDNVLQPMQFNSSPSIRRYSISSSEHVIRVIHHGSEKSAMYAFSLRVAQEPRTKWIKGNDSTQVVMQTAAIKPVTYVTKYNNIPGAETKLEWIGNQANGINLTTIPGTLTDTLRLEGNANCAVGTYNYAVVAYYNNVETSRATGKFKVASDIQATSETNVEVYQNEEMDQITFNYFALSANDVQLTWTNTTPAGITGSGSNGKYIIGGTPTTIGTYPFTITVVGADTIISGQIKVKELNYGTNPILYLHKNNSAYEHDGIYQYLKSKGKNLIERKAKIDGLRQENQYKNYKLIIISEDADADNAEVLAVIRGGANLPILNLKGFTYTSDRLNWGEPDNGAVDSMATKDKGCNIWIEQANHPVFKQLTNKNRGEKVKILSSYERNGVMPIAITNAPGTLCLATGMTRSIDDYYAEGEQQTAIHEVPASMRGGQKYICLPVASRVNLSTQGEKLIDGILDYLLSQEEPSINTPTLEITGFSVGGIDANINQGNNTISLRMTEQQYTDLDSLKSVEPSITLADPNTHVSPAGKVSLQYMYVIPQAFVVTDYISRRVYEFMLDLYDPHEGIDNIYEAGQWINIFDIYGRKVATTNEDFRTMDLPRGMYIIVTESGQTIKIMR